MCGAGSHTSCLHGVHQEEVPTGVNLNGYAGSRSHIPWHSDNWPMFGPQISPKLRVSMSFGYSVEFQMSRRAPDDVPSPIRLDHGDLLVMDGLAQSEYVHRTVSGLQGPRVNLTFRWETEHISSGPLAGVVCCAPPSCVQGLAEPGLRGGEAAETKWAICWWMVLMLLIWACVLWRHAWIKHWCPASIPPGVALPSMGSRALGWVKALATVATLPSPKESFFWLSCGNFGRENYVLLGRTWLYGSANC